MDEKTYDLVIIGAGPAGYSAAIYASRYRLKTLVIGELVGGLITEAHLVCNYPGYESISGIDLMVKFQDQALKNGAQELNDRVIDLQNIGNAENSEFQIKTSRSGEFKARNIILATGSKHRRLGLPNEENFVGKGISYCATCDALFYKEKIVGVIGGSNSAVMAAMYLAEVASKVYVFYRGDTLRGEPAWVEQLKSNSKIEVLFGSNVVELKEKTTPSGMKKLGSVILDKDNREILLDGLFIEIGYDPDLSLPKFLNVEVDERGYIKVDSSMRTNIKGVYSAGDITTASNGFRQVITATSEGAIAANTLFFDHKK